MRCLYGRDDSPFLNPSRKAGSAPPLPNLSWSDVVAEVISKFKLSPGLPADVRRRAVSSSLHPSFFLRPRRPPVFCRSLWLIFVVASGWQRAPRLAAILHQPPIFFQPFPSRLDWLLADFPLFQPSRYPVASGPPIRIPPLPCRAPPS